MCYVRLCMLWLLFLTIASISATHKKINEITARLDKLENDTTSFRDNVTSRLDRRIFSKTEINRMIKKKTATYIEEHPCPCSDAIKDEITETIVRQLEVNFTQELENILKEKEKMKQELKAEILAEISKTNDDVHRQFNDKLENQNNSIHNLVNKMDAVHTEMVNIQASIHDTMELKFDKHEEEALKLATSQHYVCKKNINCLGVDLFAAKESQYDCITTCTSRPDCVAVVAAQGFCWLKSKCTYDDLEAADGVDTFLKLVIFFSATVNTPTVLDMSAVIPFSFVNVNLGGAYDGTTSVFTCPVNGYYMVSVSIITGALNGEKSGAQLMINGLPLYEMRHHVQDTQNHGGPSHTRIVPCLMGQMITARVFDASTQIGVGSTFMALLIGHYDDIPNITGLR